MKKALLTISVLALSAFMLMGCTTAGAESDGTPDTEQAETTQYTLADTAGLLGKADADVADAFGGGEENWTTDKSTYIGRIYQTELYGDPVTVRAVCGEEKVMDAVSIWITDGEQEVTDELVQTWQDRVTAFTGAEMEDRGVSGESGTQSWRWNAEDNFYTLRLLEDILTLDINPAVGELK